MAKLREFRQYHINATGKVSENTRTLALSALALMWLFKKEVAGTYEVPHALLVPLLLVVLALALDFSQYVYRSIVFHHLFRREEMRLEKKEITEDDELHINTHVNTPAYALFYLKVICLVIAYIELLSHLSTTIRWK